MLLYNCPKGTADNNPKGRKEKHGKYDSFLNQQYAEGKTELEAYRNLMAILGLTYPQKSEKEKAK